MHVRFPLYSCAGAELGLDPSAIGAVQRRGGILWRQGVRRGVSLPYLRASALPVTARGVGMPAQKRMPRSRLSGPPKLDTREKSVQGGSNVCHAGIRPQSSILSRFAPAAKELQCVADTAD